MLNIAESVRRSCRALISVCGAIPATQSQCGKSRGCHYHQHQPRRRPHPYCHHWRQCHHHCYLTNGRRHSVAKLTSFADWVFAAFWILAVYQTVWKETFTNLIKHHHENVSSSNLTSVIVDLVVALLFELNIAARSIPAGLTEAFPGHPVGRHRAGAVAWDVCIQGVFSKFWNRL